MDDGQHAPGCDLLHSGRQRCNVPGAIEAETGGPAATAWSGATNSISLKLFAVVFASLCVVAAGIGGIVVFADGSGEEPKPWYRAELPAFARPAGAVELRSEAGCPVEGPWWPPCRTMTFGTNRDYQATIDELRATLEVRGWASSIEYHDYSLHMIDYENVMCVLYFDDSASAPAKTASSDAPVHEVTIEVVIDQCGAQF